MEKNRIYCSGPLFCAEEVGGMSAMAKVLEDAGFETFLPHRDGIEGYVMRFGNAAFANAIPGIRSGVDSAIFALDVYELIERCNGMVCNLNGRVPDEGMIVEASLAYAAGKPLVLFKDDVRSPFGGYDNSMLTGLVHGKIVGKLSDIPAAIREQLTLKTEFVPPSGDLKKAVAYGKRISALMKRLPEQAGKKQWTEEVLREVIATALTDERS